MAGGVGVDAAAVGWGRQRISNQRTEVKQRQPRVALALFLIIRHAVFQGVDGVRAVRINSRVGKPRRNKHNDSSVGSRAPERNQAARDTGSHVGKARAAQRLVGGVVKHDQGRFLPHPP